MAELETKQKIVSALKVFGSRPLIESALTLFDTLGYRSGKKFRLEPNTPDAFIAQLGSQPPLSRQQALVEEWESVDFLFQLTDEEIRAASSQHSLFESKGKWNGAVMESYLFFAIALKKPSYSRTELSSIARAVNRSFRQPVMLLFRHGQTLTLAVINRRLHKREESKDVLEKVTLIKDIRLADPHRAHTEILYDLSLEKLREKYHLSNFVQLHEAWQKSLDSSELNKRFFQDLANWYFWALENVRFPDGAPKDRDGRDSLSLIRLITRLIFCWFLREKGLIPEELFRERSVHELLTSLDDNENSFYTAILQNLFFATLNTEMDVSGQPPNRHFVMAGKDSKSSEDHMVHTLWRHQDRIKNRARFEQLLRSIPFLNGGLFECLDTRVEQGKSSFTREVRVDGFSGKPAKQPRVPNFLFFGPDRQADLSQAYGEIRYRQTKVRPLIPLLEHYKFTVAENTPIEEEVALDPELLGLVFENLLAAYNPETDKVARRTTGSFYTPRTVVDFMVDEALVAWLKDRVGGKPTSEASAKRMLKASAEPADIEEPLRSLLSYSSEQPKLSPDQARQLVEAIDEVKILDPACGSGAFPIGALHKLVFLLRKLDPGNASWKERQLSKARQLDVGRDAAIAAVEETFARDAGDYARKLYLIENCLYGVDIQPIAVQIAKLRCFVSLVVEQQPDDSLPNRGILPLPNLETNFVTANTLIRLHRSGQRRLIDNDATEKVEALQETLRRVRHSHFLARKYSEKKALRKQDRELRKELAEVLKASHVFPGREAERVASWDPYYPDGAAEFFDPEWMFNLDPTREKRSAATLRSSFRFVREAPAQSELVAGEKATSGFDIVIGNPPYVRQEEVKHFKVFAGASDELPLKEALKNDMYCYTGVADLYVYFYERSFDLLKVGGVLCFISSNKYFRSGYGERLRHFLTYAGEVLRLIDFGDAPVFNAIAYPSIIVVRKTKETEKKNELPGPSMGQAKPNGDRQVRVLTWQPGPPIADFPEIFKTQSFIIPQESLTADGWRLESATLSKILEKLRLAGKPLGEYVNGRFYYGIKTGLNEAFVVDRTTQDRLIREHKSSAEVLKPFIRGRDVKRWRCEFAGQYLLFVPWHFPLHLDASIQGPSKEAERKFEEKYPAVYAHLKGFKAELSARNKAETGIHYEWYALQRWAAEYWQEFEKPKILYQEIATYQAFAWDPLGHFTNNKTFLIPDPSKVLLAILNSRCAWWFLDKVASKLAGGAFAMQTTYVSQLPIPPMSKATDQQIRRLIDRISSSLGQDPNAFVGEDEAELDGLIAHLYGLKEEEFSTILGDLALPDPVRVGAANAYRDVAKGLFK